MTNVDTTTAKPVLELQAGDMLDLEGDPHADPDGDDAQLAHEYATVESVEREGDTVVIVHTDVTSVAFPVGHYVPVYDAVKDQAGVALAVVNVVQALHDRGGPVPSHDVQRAAAELVFNQDVSVDVGRHFRVYHVTGSRGIRYVVVLNMADDSPNADVVSGECTCDAGRASRVCKHLTAVLTTAARHGHILQVPESQV